MVAQWAILLGPLALVVVWIVGTAEDRSSAVATGFAATLALVLAAILSTLIDAPRPFVDGGASNYLHHVRDGSFPSDHATLAFAIAAGFWRRRPSRAPFVWLPLMVVAIAIVWARVFLGAHYLSDIAGGAVVGAVAVAVTTTPIARTALGGLDVVGEHLRAGALATWGRLLARTTEGHESR